ncbi:MAG: hypothetical protein HOM48_04055 [Rhodobiaceae bacterium]|nr:hypothetical protein [Rhodobiaceae bacterium]
MCHTPFRQRLRRATSARVMRSEKDPEKDPEKNDVAFGLASCRFFLEDMEESSLTKPSLTAR